MSEKFILIADDDPGVTTTLRLLLDHNSEKSITASTPEDVLKCIQDYEISLVLLDLNFSSGQNTGHEGLNILKELQFSHPEIPILILTSHSDIDIAVECMRVGAKDFILKPWDNSKLITRIKELLITGSRVQNRDIKKHELIGKSNAISEIKVMIPRLIQSSVSVLITGERGTGKYQLAKHISEKYCGSKKFHNVNFKNNHAYAHLEDVLLKGNSECLVLNRLDLAHEDHFNLIREVLHLNRNCKLISTSSRKDALEILGHETKMALSLIELELPPLRSRKEDIEILSEYFIEHLSELYDRPMPKLSMKSLVKLKQYLWPGNIAELKHTLERAVILSNETSIDASLIRLGAVQQKGQLEKSSSLNLAILEKEAILEALNTSSGNVTKAAKILGITRAALYRRMEKHDI